MPCGPVERGQKTVLQIPNHWVKLTGTTLRSVPAAYPRRYAHKR
jgi:hypothetical protein